MGGNFFIIQIGIIIIFSINVLVSNLVSSAEVTEYLISITRIVVTFLSIYISDY